MPYYRLQFIFLIAVSIVGTACGQSANTNGWHHIVGTAYGQNASTNDWHPNTARLDILAKFPDSSSKEAYSTLAHDVENFYQLLRDKRWHKTYELRAKAFREDTSEDDYIAKALKYESKWGLVNYEILNVGLQNSEPTNGLDTAILICKFTELPGNYDSYATVFWHKEDGVWRCLSAGPSGIDIFRGTRPPLIDWR